MNEPTKDELNHIQQEWMKLEPDAPVNERKRVLDLMTRYPTAYVSCDAMRTMGVVNLCGVPINQPIPYKDALTLCGQHNGRTDVVWMGAVAEWREA